jgi:hypothetical protein
MMISLGASRKTRLTRIAPAKIDRCASGQLNVIFSENRCPLFRITL